MSARRICACALTCAFTLPPRPAVPCATTIVHYRPPHRSEIDAYVAPSEAARRQLAWISRAGSLALRNAIVRHFAATSTSMEHASSDKTLIANAIATSCRGRDVDLSTARAVTLSIAALAGDGALTKAIAPLAYRDIFAAIYARPHIANAVYRRAVSGFIDGPGPNVASTKCAVPNAPVTIARAVTLEHPDIAKQQGRSGTTLVAVILDATGRPVAVSIYKSSGFAILDQSALGAARSTQYRPAIDDCIPVPGRYIFTANFNGS